MDKETSNAHENEQLCKPSGKNSALARLLKRSNSTPSPQESGQSVAEQISQNAATDLLPRKEGVKPQNAQSITELLGSLTRSPLEAVNTDPTKAQTLASEENPDTKLKKSKSNFFAKATSPKSFAFTKRGRTMSSPLGDIEKEAARRGTAPKPSDPNFNFEEEKKKMKQSYFVTSEEPEEEEKMGYRKIPKNAIVDHGMVIGYTNEKADSEDSANSDSDSDSESVIDHKLEALLAKIDKHTTLSVDHQPPKGKMTVEQAKNRVSHLPAHMRALPAANDLEHPRSSTSTGASQVKSPVTPGASKSSRT